jgi:hypothetical protein
VALNLNVQEPSDEQPKAVPVVATEYMLPDTRDMLMLLTLTDEIEDVSVAVTFTRIASELRNIESFTQADVTLGLVASTVNVVVFLPTMPEYVKLTVTLCTPSLEGAVKL